MSEPIQEKPYSRLAVMAKALFDFAIDRDDVKWTLSQLPPDESVPLHRIDYELQLLKMVTTGWSIAVYLADDPGKEDLLQAYWNLIRTFSKELSQTTELMTGCDVDYFELLKERLDDYVAVIAAQWKGNEPARFIGTRFAEICEYAGDLAISVAGSRMFNTIVMRVEKYLSEQSPLDGTVQE